MDFNTELNQTDLNISTVSTLGKAGIKHVGQLVQLQHFRQIAGLDRTGKAALSMFLQRNGLALGQDVGAWEPPEDDVVAPRVQTIGPAKNGSIYKVLLIGGEKRGKGQVKGLLSKRGAVVEWQWTYDKKRQRATAKSFPVGCDLILRMADLSATMTNEYKKLAEADGIVFLSITRKKAQWANLLDELGLKERAVAAEDVLAAEKEAQRVAEREEQAVLDQKIKKVLAESTKPKTKPKPALKPQPKTPVVDVVKAPDFGLNKHTPTLPLTVKETGHGYTLPPITQRVSDFIAKGKMHNAVYEIAQRVDRLSGTFDTLLPLLLKAMEQEDIRSLLITDGKNVEYTRNTPKPDAV